MKPTHSILDRSFRYTSADHTDLRKSFAKVREARAAEAEAAKAKRAEDEKRWAEHLRYEEPPANVTELRKVK